MPKRNCSTLASAVSSICSRRRRVTIDDLGLAAIAAVSLWGTAANAQNPTPSADAPEEITITGSRLRRDIGMSTPTPTTALDIGEMRAMAPTLLMDSLDQLPQFRDNALSQSGSIFTSGGGSQAVNLRGIGTNRTLTLLNGRRLVPGQQSGTPDVAILPTALIQRVEVVTGGASAAYGSDAISGVTNFILDTNFEGAKANLNTGMTSRHDHQNWQAEFAAGSAIGEKGHIIGSVDYFDADGVIGYEGRDWGADGWAMFTRATNPLRFYAPNGRSRVITSGGLIPSGPLAFTQFVDGDPVPLGNGQVIGTAMIGGGGPDLNQEWANLRPDDKRHSAFLHYKHDFSDTKTGYIQLMQGVHENTTLPSPTGMAPGWGMTIFAENPYIPASLRTRMGTMASFPFNRVFEDLSPSRSIEDTATTMTIGFDGEIGNDLFLSAYVQQGKNEEHADYSENGLLVRTDRLYRALDSVIDPATGRIVCRANLFITPAQEAQISKINVQGKRVWADPESNRGCIPFDPFATHLPREAIDYVTGGIHHDQELTQDVLEATLQTDIGEDRRQGSISVGGGVSYREEKLFQEAFGNAGDPRRLQDFGVFNEVDGVPIRGLPGFVRDRGVFVTGNPNSQGPIEGAFDVWEVFGESIIPIIGDRGGDSGVELHVAARYADYAGSGGVWASKLGADWRINPAVRFRATVSRDTRAGTLSERFDTQGAGANIALGQDPLLPTQTYIAGLTTGGNPEIRPELADTTTMGVVWQPEWADNFSFSADLYNIEIQDAIAQLGTQEILDRCYLQGAQEICALISRNDTGTPFIRQILNVFINIAETKTSGVDLETSWRKDMRIFGGGDEEVSVRFFANYLDEVSSQFVGVAALNEAGEIGNPQWLATGTFAYTNGPFRFSWQTRYRDATIREVLWRQGIEIEDNSVSGRTYTNLNLSYDLEWGDASGQAYFYVGNLFDKDPPLVPGAVGATTGTATYTDNNRFDTLGRVYSVGVNFQF
ncbi:MAG TPA: TonB-dependent receptor [Gammaproteobacteria bacterium]|nr:TonB-dependent receptor [Gammaproteobacteria bacterium]